MHEKYGDRNLGRSFRKRYMVSKGRCFSLHEPALNLSTEEYNRRLEYVKKMGNMC